MQPIQTEAPNSEYIIQAARAYNHMLNSLLSKGPVKIRLPKNNTPFKVGDQVIIPATVWAVPMTPKTQELTEAMLLAATTPYPHNRYHFYWDPNGDKEDSSYDADFIIAEKVYGIIITTFGKDSDV